MADELSRYHELFGADFLKKALEKRDRNVFEAIWRLQDEGVSGRAAEGLASFDSPELSALLLDGLLDGQLGPNVAEEIRSAVRNYYPRLDSISTTKLAAWIREHEPPSGTDISNHEVLEVWLLKQPGNEGDSRAEEALCGRFSYRPSGSITSAAMDRCHGDSSLAERVATRLEAEIAEEGDSAAWTLGATFLKGMSAEKRPPAYIEPLGDRLLMTASQLYAEDTFNDSLGRCLVSSSAPTLKKILSGDALPDSPGSRALVLLHEKLKQPRERAKTFTNVLSSQPAVWASIRQTAYGSWDSEEWARRISAVDRSNLEFDTDSLVALLEEAPNELAGPVIRLVTQLEDEPSEEMTSVAAKTLGAYLEPPTGEGAEEDEGDFETIQVPWWPKALSSRKIGIFDRLLREAIAEPRLRLEQIAVAVSQGQLGTTEASLLVDIEEYESFLGLFIPGQLRGDLALALADVDPGGLGDAVQSIHNTQGFQIDLVASAARQTPSMAFFGAGDAYETLDAQGRDKLLAFLEEFATIENIDVLDAIVQDTHKDNSDYRRRAALRIGQITPAGDPLPSSVVELLQSNRPELVDAAATVIERVKPEDEDLVRLLRSVALNSEETSEARAALESLAKAFVALLVTDPPKERRVHILRLLAAAATSDVVDSLLSHVGRDAVDDDPDVRKIAASGLREVASQGSIDRDHLTRLVHLTEEERHPAAKDDLNAAVSQASLGEDAALNLLQEMVEPTPTGDLRQLLGQEKERVVRQLELLATERERGSPGWPGVIMQLDLIAERVLRVAYLKVGRSGKLKKQIRDSPTTPDYGSLIQALASVSSLHGIQGQLKTLHDLRSQKTEFTHIGEAPDEDDVTTANTCFVTALRSVVGVLGKD